MKKLLALLVLALVFVTGCKNDDSGEVTDLTTKEASDKIVSSGQDAAADVVSMVESEGVTALIAFADLFSDFDQFTARTADRSWVKSKLEIISNYFVYGPAGRVNNDEFAFDDIKGVHSWNFELEMFEKTDDSEFFIVNFPSEGSTTNNAELKITDLQFITITETDEWGTYEDDYPTAIEGTLKVDGETFISLSASADWSSEGFPEKASIDLMVSPFTFLLDFDDTNTLTSTASASISKSGETLVGVSVLLTFETADKEEPTDIDGHVQYGSVKLKGSVDIAGYEANEYDANDEPNPNFDANDYVDLEVLIDDVKVGDIIFIDDVAYIAYNDGTKEILEEILEEVIEDIEDAFEEFEDDED
jgi:hypothetical protein